MCKRERKKGQVGGDISNDEAIKERPRRTHPRLDPPCELLRHVHRVRNRDDDELRARQRRPVEKVVDDVLFGREELIELVHEDDAITEQAEKEERRFKTREDGQRKTERRRGGREEKR
jgi:hypothetical protein